VHATTDQLTDRRDAVEARVVDERLVVTGRQRVPARTDVSAGIIDLKNGGGCLLLERT